MFRRFSINFAILSIVFDIILIQVNLNFASFLRPLLNSFSFISIIPAPIQVPSLLYVLFPLIWVALLLSFSLYDGRKNLKAIDEFTNLALTSFLAGISMAGVLFMSYRDISRAFFILFFLLSYLSLIIWRIVARFLFRQTRIKAEIRKRIIIISSPNFEISFLDNIKNNELVANCEIFQINTASLHAELNNGKKKLSIVSDILLKSPTDIIVALPRNEEYLLRNIVSALEKEPYTVWIALDFYELALNSAGIESIGGVPMINLREPALSDYQRMVKRGFDIVVSSVFFLLVIPFLTMIAILVLIIDGRPVIFKQLRVGENGKLFSIFKFRTMRNGFEKEIGKYIQDHRVTKLGKVLRRFSIDELPQLINVIQGTMSLVGPRPEIPEYVDNYPAEQRMRLAVTPGITGWWQVNGRSDLPLYLNFEHDLFYVRNYSIWLDFRILWRTVWVVILGSGAF